jgi:anti-sigma regulatory factor (Ser/Thr protein kinase)
MRRQLELELTSDPSESKRLRKELHAWLLDEAINGATGQDIILAASEAFANSVQHPTGRTSERISLRGTIKPDRLVVVEIADDGQWQPNTDPRRTHLGYFLMRATTDSVETTKTQQGTRVILTRQA